jgi:hypothetical protein
LYLRGGTYYEGGITTSLKGTVSQPITIASYPGERAVIDGGVPDYKAVPNTGWELVDASVGLYRTTKTYSGTVGAWLINDDTQLIQYADAANLESTNYVLNGSKMYFGPGVQLRSDGKLYIRLQPNPQDLKDASGNAIPSVPVDSNPNNNSLSVFTTQTLLTLQGASYLHFKDMTFQYARRIMDLQTGTKNISLTNCIINYGSHGILATGADTGEITGCDFNNGVPMAMYWTDVKNSEAGAGNEPYPEFQSNALNAFSNLNIHHNTFRRSFDGISLKEGGVSNVTIRNNYFLQLKDDAINLSLDNSNVEIAYNLFWHHHSGISLFKHTGAPGEVYIHHNVLDGSMLTRTGRPGNYRAGSYPPWAGGNPFSGHDGESAAHWKVYNNTFISHLGRQPSTTMSPGAVTGNSGKYFYNNIFYVHDDRILLGDDQESSGSHYDGNVFWQAGNMSGARIMFDNFGRDADYGCLAPDRCAGALPPLRAPGTTLSWEVLGMQANPGFDVALLRSGTFDYATVWQRYLPTNALVLTPGQTYTGLDWPGTAGVTYRGAVDSLVVPPSPPALLRIGP